MKKLLILTVIIVGGSYTGIIFVTTKYIPYPWYVPVFIVGGLLIVFGWMKLIGKLLVLN